MIETTNIVKAARDRFDWVFSEYLKARKQHKASGDLLKLSIELFRQYQVIYSLYH